MSDFTWEQTKDGQWLVVEHGGMLKTGPFSSKEKARDFFQREFEEELEEVAHEQTN